MIILFFPGGVALFDPVFLSNFFTKIGTFCTHQKGNFLNFSKLTLLLSLVHFWCPLWPVKRGSPFFLGHPVDIKIKSWETGLIQCLNLYFQFLLSRLFSTGLSCFSGRKCYNLIEQFYSLKIITRPDSSQPSKKIRKSSSKTTDSVIDNSNKEEEKTKQLIENKKDIQFHNFEWYFQLRRRSSTSPNVSLSVRPSVCLSSS